MAFWCARNVVCHVSRVGAYNEDDLAGIRTCDFVACNVTEPIASVPVTSIYRTMARNDTGVAPMDTCAEQMCRSVLGGIDGIELLYI